MDTIGGLLAQGPQSRPAIGAPDQAWLSYADALTLVRHAGHALNARGIGRGDRVAIVGPNGPSMATAFLAVASHATAAPLNPGYKAKDFAFYLDDLNAKALVLPAGDASAARAVAMERGIAVIELMPAEGAGAFTIAPRPAPDSTEAAARPGPSAADEVALLLHTSGTTARPKLVPLTHANLLASAVHIGRTLALTPDDICLNIMPLFHIHGLVAALLSSLAAGGAVCCAPGLNAAAFFAWIEDVGPTWYTAVPSMHQSILPFAARSADVLASARLRFIRSSSASLPPAVMAALEAAFGVPVIEAYGMTEAAHQMASNPLPPGRRIAGSVGLAAGPDVAVMDPAGALLPPGADGEVVIRGPNVMAGYEANPAANAAAFDGGWFRTGDLGRIDPAGYLQLRGRLKEIISRGGEKISPIEIDNALMEHQAVQQAATFGIPDAQYGEAVAAVIVLREGMAADSQAIRRHAASALPDWKVPKIVVFVDEIPKGPTGKLQRNLLAGWYAQSFS